MISWIPFINASMLLCGLVYNAYRDSFLIFLKKSTTPTLQQNEQIFSTEFSKLDTFTQLCLSAQHLYSLLDACVWENLRERERERVGCDVKRT
jgi:hypothetical protein